jgi:L-threonylcarbamoyladenylate synthase
MVPKDIIETIKGGGIGVMPTDTMYGIVGSAFNKKTVERVYEVRRRNRTKPLIILISSIKDLEKFGIKNIPVKFLNSLWPDKITVILTCAQKKFEYLHRGTKKLGFRLPKDKWLQEFIKKTGPIVAPSANIEGEKPSKNIKQAEEYFGASVDFYLDKGVMPINPSTIVELVGDKDVFELNLIRKGAVNLNI